MATPNRNPMSFSGPEFTRVTESLELEPPPQCVASVILRLVASDVTPQVYAFWLVVGRHQQQAVSVPYEFTPGDVRCDVPEGKFPYPELLEAPFQDFVIRERALRRKGNFDQAIGLEPPPPTIKR